MSLELFRYSYKWLLFVIVFSWPFILIGQLDDSRKEACGAIAIQQIWPQIEEKLTASTPDTAFYFMLALVREQSQEDLNCAYHAYEAIRLRLESLAKHAAAIYIAEEMVKIAQLKQEPIAEADAFRNVSRYHHALGNIRLSLVALDKSLELYKEYGDFYRLASTTMWKLERTMRDVAPEIYLPQMDSLLDEAVTQRDSNLMLRLNGRLIYIKLNNDRFEEVMEHIKAVEQIHDTPSRRSIVNGAVIQAARGRAELAYMRNDYNEAEKYYQKALFLSRKADDLWLQIFHLEQLGIVEWERNNRLLAKSYIDTALNMALTAELEERLPVLYARKANFAEEEEDFETALEYTKKQFALYTKYYDKSKNFNMQNYYLQIEKNQLETEKQNQELALQLRESQNRNLVTFLGLAALILAVLSIGYINQQRSKRALTQQNNIIKEQADRLKNLDLAKSRFFANISHELRTPLSLLLGPIQSLLKEKGWSPKQIQLLQFADKSGKVLEQLVKEILDLTKLEMGKMDLNSEQVHLKSFFEQSLAQFDSLAELHQIQYTYQVQLEETLWVNFDKAKCRHILNNLLSNAFKFTPSGGLISTIVHFEEDSLKFKVTDSGRGIPKEDLPHLFDRYFQTSKPEKLAEGGTGIGLAICKEYTLLMKGNIKVESTEGKGSTFFVELPVKVIPEPMLDHSVSDIALTLPMVGKLQEPESQNIATSPGVGKKTVLVVEDNRELQNYIELIIGQQYHVLKAENGLTALNILKSNQKCDLILSDLMMPGMNGFQLLEKIKGEDSTRHLPFIMLTARADIKDKLKALRIGVDDYLLKPFIEEEVLARIANLIANQENRYTASDNLENKPSFSKEDSIWLGQFESFIKDNLGSGLLSVPTLAEQFTMSESTLLRQLKRLTGLTPVKYIQEIRLSKARELLEGQTFNNVAKIAYEIGYKDVRSFSRIFKKRFGKLPSDFFQNL